MSERDSICASAEKPLDPKYVERFWKRVNKEGPIPGFNAELGPCWVWTGTLLSTGYGQMAIGARERFSTHRLAWLLHTGKSPDGQINHKCDNPSCVRPSHLYDGTQADNAKDAAERLRYHARGNHCRAKINPDIVREIRMRRESGETLQAIGDRFGITKQNVRLIVKGLAWVHVK
jgi:hypothetical protein